MKEEIEKLIEEQGLVDAMKKSAFEASKALDAKMEEFFVKHFGVKKGGSICILELVKKATEKRA